MDDILDDNPQWLQSLVLADMFQWNNAYQTTFGELFEAVTYHDSHWVASITNKSLEHVLIIRLDGFWNKEYSHYDESIQDWPFSLIKIEDVQSIKYKRYEDRETNTISSSESHITEGVAVTRFDDIYGGFIELKHNPNIKVLLMSAQGEYFPPNPDVSINTTEKESEVRLKEFKWWKFWEPDSKKIS